MKMKVFHNTKKNYFLFNTKEPEGCVENRNKSKFILMKKYF